MVAPFFPTNPPRCAIYVTFSSVLKVIRTLWSAADGLFRLLLLVVQAKDLKFDNEYSRLIGAIGKDALKRLQAAKVLLVGLNGLGLEIGAFSYFPLSFCLPFELFHSNNG